MAATKNDSKTVKMIKRLLGTKERLIFTVFIIVLVIAIVCVSVFWVYPKLAGRPDWQIMGSLNFSDNSWIKDMVKGRIKTTDQALDISSSFVYSEDTAYLTYTYASQTSVESAKKFYLGQIPGSIDYKSDSVAQMNIKGKLQGEGIEVVNYEADMLNAYDVKVIIAKDKADAIKNKLIAEFPMDALNKVSELAEILKNEKLGGYIMYNDDQLSSSSYPGIPIYSLAYRYSGSKDDLIRIEKIIKDKYPDSLYFEDIGTVYFKTQGYIMSLNYSESDLNKLAVITMQKIPDTEKATST